MEDCVDLARARRRVADELGIPVYLYEEAATRAERRNLANIRQGEYEGLAAKLRDRAWKPDFGPAVFNPASGATVIGAREFLIAYNVNLNTRDLRIAREIAFEIREKGRAKRDASGAIVEGRTGETVFEPGKFKACKAVGWYMEDFGRAQVSINLVNYKVTPLHAVFDECVRLPRSTARGSRGASSSASSRSRRCSGRGGTTSRGNGERRASPSRSSFTSRCCPWE